jgi:GT2 family glycosyltransferase
VLPQRHIERVERSRQKILEALGETRDLVFVRALGNFGDELIWAGTRELLSGSGHAYREIDVKDLSSVRGNTALICGSGGFCHSYHELMPHVLAVAEMRFERVILLPSTFDITVDAVRYALERTRAVVFAREQESYSQIRPLCDAHLAHDCAFFFDYTPYAEAGSGVLQAFRIDAESTGERPIPSKNDDISLTAGSLETWLHTIARHELIRTDRAHVMIAAALLGKAVEFDSSNYHKVPAIADYALSSFPVMRLPPAATAAAAPARFAPYPCTAEAGAIRERLTAKARSNPPPAIKLRDSAGAPRVTAVIISFNRPELALGVLHSLVHLTSVPLNILIIDNNSTPRTRRLLTEACAAHQNIRLHLSDRNLGCAGGRRLALELIDTELVLFLDDDTELLPGTLAHLMSALDRHPRVGGVAPLVVLPDGRVSHSGGYYNVSDQIVTFAPMSAGVQFDDPSLPASGRCDWIQGASLIRTSLLTEVPWDPGMTAYYEDNEWCYRVAKARSDCFYRSREAIILHHADHKPWGRRDFIGRADLTRFISAAAHFYRVHGVLLGAPGGDVFSMMPELTRTNETLDLVGARLVMELANTHSTDWLLMEWMNGGLDPVLGIERTALGDRLHSCQVSNASLSAQLAATKSALDAVIRARDEMATDLQAIRITGLGKLASAYVHMKRTLTRSLASRT